MKKKTLIIGGIAAASLLVGGWAVAQTVGHRHGGPSFMQGEGHRGMGHGGMMGNRGQRGQGMHGQQGDGMRGQMGQGQRGGPGFAQFDPARVETLKKDLAITAAQEPAWTKYAKAIQDQAEARKATREKIDHDAVRKMNADERLTFMTQMREQRQKEVEAVQTALKELLATLDDAQKTKAQDTLPGLAFGPGKMHAGMGGRHFRH